LDAFGSQNCTSVSPFEVPSHAGVHVIDLYPVVWLKRPQQTPPPQSAALSHAIGIPWHWPGFDSHV
jgi:hypothetical protein